MGCSGYDFKGWAAVDLATGELRHTTRDPSSGSVIFADGRLYCLSERGVMALLKPAPSTFEVAGRFTLVEGPKQDAWAHPVICDGCLYLRYHDALFCYDVRAK